MQLHSNLVRCSRHNRFIICDSCNYFIQFNMIAISASYYFHCWLPLRPICCDLQTTSIRLNSISHWDISSLQLFLRRTIHFVRCYFMSHLSHCLCASRRTISDLLFAINANTFALIQLPFEHISWFVLIAKAFTSFCIGMITSLATNDESHRTLSDKLSQHSSQHLSQFPMCFRRTITVVHSYCSIGTRYHHAHSTTSFSELPRSIKTVPQDILFGCYVLQH